MNRDWLIRAISVAVGVLLTGCMTKVSESCVSIEISPQMLHRAELFRKAVGKYSNGVVIGSKTRKFYHGREAVLAARCQAAGFTEVYIKVIPSKLNEWFSDYPEDIERLLTAMHKEKIFCYAQFDCNDLFACSEKDRSLLGDEVSPVAERARKVVRFNADKPNEAFDGIEPVILPSKLNEDCYSAGLLYHWSETAYGRRGENDILMQCAIRMMSEIRKAAGTLKVAENITDFYHDRTLSQDLTRGQPRYFLKHSDFLIICVDSGQGSRIFKDIRLELKAESKQKSISVRITLDSDSYGSGSTKIKTVKWDSVVKELSRLSKKAGKFDAFRGFMIDDYESFERVWLR